MHEAGPPQDTMNRGPHSGVSGSPATLVCFSHLRWGFVFQRPQHLLTRAARSFRVIFVEEAGFEPVTAPRLQLTTEEGGVTVAVPILPEGLDEDAAESAQRALIDGLLSQVRGRPLVFWYYTPMALGFTDHHGPDVCVYDCMDELSAFRFAPAKLRDRERLLLERADLVFTGGQSLYEAKKGRHPSVHAFPSSIDAPHFARARGGQADPDDQSRIPRPRLGFFGVIDERMDLQLLRKVAELRPDWQFVMIGPVVKIDDATLPRLPNIHWLGGKPYEGLPSYLAGWDVGLMPFAINESTRYISPTKTPEFLAAAFRSYRRRLWMSCVHTATRGWWRSHPMLKALSPRPPRFFPGPNRVASAGGPAAVRTSRGTRPGTPCTN
jgi:UDP-galactopyranose mutase